MPEPLLTPRQLQVAQLMAQDYTPKQIANELGISRQCVSQHLSKMRTRLGVNTPTGIVLMLIESGEIKELTFCNVRVDSLC